MLLTSKDASGNTQYHLPPMAEPRPGYISTSYSSWSQYCKCPRSTYLSKILGIKPIARPRALTDGSCVHGALQAYRTYNSWDYVESYIRLYCSADNPDKLDDPVAKAMIPLLDVDDMTVENAIRYHRYTAMLKGYMDKYGWDEFEVVALEYPFLADIINPATGARSRRFQMKGIVDGILYLPNDGYYLLEYKTSSMVNANYLNKLWSDFQSILYTTYIERILGVEIKGTVYDMLCKDRLSMKGGETEEEFEARKLGMAQPGRAKRKMPETYKEFGARLSEKYSDPSMFVRQVLHFNQQDRESVESNVWALTQAYGRAIKSTHPEQDFFKCQGACYGGYSPCEYAPLCSSHMDQFTLDMYYTVNGATAGDNATEWDDLESGDDAAEYVSPF